jgi:hypothetical protein
LVEGFREAGYPLGASLKFSLALPATAKPSLGVPEIDYLEALQPSKPPAWRSIAHIHTNFRTYFLITITAWHMKVLTPIRKPMHDLAHACGKNMWDYVGYVGIYLG